ncbi:MAG: leucine-rich repeat protein, partial [Candidatus Nanopelagicales bacterium]
TFTGGAKPGGGGGGGSTKITGAGGIEIVAGGGGGGGSANSALTGGSGGNGAASNTVAGGNGGLSSSGTMPAGNGGSGGSNPTGGAGAAGSQLTTAPGGDGVDGAGSNGRTQTNYGGGGGGGGAGGGSGAYAQSSASGGGAGGSKVSSDALSASYAPATTGAGAGATAVQATLNDAAGTAGNNGNDGSVVITALNAPNITDAEAGSGQATITWTEPTQPDGVGTTTYQVYKDGDPVDGATSSPATVTGLTNGVEYELTVVATSSLGLVTTSAASQVTPEAEPVTEDCITYEISGATATVVGFTSIGCSWTTTLTIPATVPNNGASVTAIGDGAFANIGVATVEMSDSVTTIGDDAFRGATSLANINFPTALTSIGASAFRDTAVTTFVAPATLTSIGDSAFNGVTALTTATLNSGLLSIGAEAFSNTRITTVAIPDSVGSMGDSVFTDAQALETVTIGTGITSLPVATFDRANQLNAVSLPATMTSIRRYAFRDNSSLQTLKLPSGLLEIGDGAFAATSLTSMTIPAGVTILESDTFKGSGIQTVNLPSGLTSIGASAFEGSGLKAIYIPNQVTTIGPYAFYGIPSLTRVTFGASVETIGSRAFAESANMTNVLWLAQPHGAGMESDAFDFTGYADWHYGQNVGSQPSAIEGADSSHSMSPAPVPTATTYTPTVGNSTGGTEVTARATAVFYGATITMGGDLCTNGATVYDDPPGDPAVSIITCDSPPGSATGVVSVVNPDGQFDDYSDPFEFNSDPGLAVGPTSKDFGQQVVGSGPSATQTFTVTSSGGGPLEIDPSGVTLGGVNDDQFNLVDDTCSGESFNPGATCTFGVAFDSGTTGMMSAEVSIASNDADSPEVIALSGESVLGAPGAPTNVYGMPGNGSATIYWTAPDTDGGSAITGYEIEQSDDGGGNWSMIGPTGSADTSFVVAGLDNDANYQFRVSAVNDEGTGPASEASSPVTPSADVFVSTWDTSLGDPAYSGTLTLPLTAVGTYDFVVDWGDGTSSTIRDWTDPERTHTYPSPATYTVTIQGQIEGWTTMTADWDAVKLLDINNWGSLQVSIYAFANASNMTITAPDTPDLSTTTSLAGMFQGATSLNVDISDWDTTAVTEMTSMFQGATSFNQALTTTDGGWDTSNVTDMSYMFYGATGFNSDVSSWDTRKVESMSSMFGFSGFNQPLETTSGGWDTRAATNLSEMFAYSSFNQSVASWDTESVTNFGNMFKQNTAYNRPMPTTSGGWDTRSALSLSGMFEGATAFNQSIASWDTSAVTFMSAMFNGATAYNQPMPATPGGWDTGAVTSMRAMFNGATSFDQNIGSWDVRGLTAGPFSGAGLMFSGALSTANYDALLVGWGAQDVNAEVLLGAGSSVYSVGPPTDLRAELAGAPNTWTITDGGQSPAPGAATNVTGVGTNTTVAVSWLAAPIPDGGAAVTLYTATALVDGVPVDPAKTCTTPDGATLTCTVTGLDNGVAYTFVVTATSSAGTGPESSPSDPISPEATVPDAPASAVAQPLIGSAAVTWAVPASDGGLPVTGYNVYRASSTMGYTDWASIAALGDVLSYSDGTTADGVSYRYRVYAINLVGTSTAYAETEIVTPSADSFISTWRTIGAAESVTLPLADGSFGGVANDYNFTVYWGDGSAPETVTSAAQGAHVYAVPGDYTVTIQ